MLEQIKVADKYKALDGTKTRDFERLAVSGLEFVSLTFSLFQIKVKWPQLKGSENKKHARQVLKDQHRDSLFKRSWQCLPEAIKKHIEQFGDGV